MFRLPVALREFVGREAEREDRSMASVIRRCVEAARQANGQVLALVGPIHVIPTYALGFELLSLGSKVFERSIHDKHSSYP